MPLNLYALEQVVMSRLAEAHAAAEREALLRAARGDDARRPGWRAGLKALLARGRGARPGIAPAPPPLITGRTP